MSDERRWRPPNGSGRGREQYFLAALDTAGGEAVPWNPQAFGGPVWCLAERGQTIYLGGTLTRLGLFPVGRLGACSAVPQQKPQTPRLALGQCFPNPVATSTTVPFALSADANATLSIYDLQERRVATPMRDEPRPAGPQHISLRVGGLPVGCYLYRLDVGETSATRKMFAIK